MTTADQVGLPVGKREPAEEQPPIARALDYLMRNHRDEDGNAATADRIAAGIGQKSISAPYIYALRSGIKRNPTVGTLQLLADYFNVGVGFFFEEDPASAYARTRELSSVATGTSPGGVNEEVPPVREAGAESAPEETTLPTAGEHDPSPVTVDLAARIETLFRLRLRPDGAPWSLRQVSAAAKARGVSLSLGFLHDLRRGVKDNPSKQQLECLAEIFDVRPGYFFDDDDTLAAVNERLEMLGAFEDEQASQIALRARNLTPHDYRMISALIDSATRARQEQDPTK